MQITSPKLVGMESQALETQVQELEPRPARQAPHHRPGAVEQARELSVLAMLRKGISQRKVAELLGCARSTVSIIAAKGQAAGEGFPDPRTAQRDAVALAVLDRCMSVGSKMPAKKIRASDAVQAVKTYAGIAWPQLEAPAGASISFTEIHIHEARITAGPGEDTTPCIELAQDGYSSSEPQSIQPLTLKDSVA